MKIVGILLLAGLFLGPGPAWGTPPQKGMLAEVKQSLNKLLADLQQMKQANDKNPDAASRARMAASIDRALKRVRAALVGKQRQALKPRAFAALYRALGRQADPRQRLQLLRTKLGSELVRSDQAVKLIQRFRVGQHRIAAAALLWLRIVDVRGRPTLQRAVGDKAAQAKLQQKLKFK